MIVGTYALVERASKYETVHFSKDLIMLRANPRLVQAEDIGRDSTNDDGNHILRLSERKIMRMQAHPSWRSIGPGL